jgi:hypothetical protein
MEVINLMLVNLLLELLEDIKFIFEKIKQKFMNKNN